MPLVKDRLAAAGGLPPARAMRLWRTAQAAETEVVRRRPGALFGHAHSIYEFAKYLEESQANIHRFDAIVATSMMLLAPHRELIERVFGIRVTNRYGCEEVGLIACECTTDCT